MGVRTLLIDADIVAYRFAAANQLNWDFEDGAGICKVVGDFDEVCEETNDYLASIAEKLKADEIIICLTHEYEYRKEILPTYKGHRDPTKKPELLKPLKDYLAAEYNSYKRPGLEADDIMGILATHPKIIPGEKIIVSIDKDLQQIPGKLYNPAKDKRLVISPEDGDRFFYTQILTGDPTDGYKGCPKVGPKRAAEILDEVMPPMGTLRDAWEAIVRAYNSKGLTEEDALLQARVARICRWTDYDFKRKQVKLWNPPK